VVDVVRRVLTPEQYRRFIEMELMYRLSDSLDHFGYGGVVYLVEPEGGRMSTAGVFEIRRALGVHSESGVQTSGRACRSTFLEEYGPFAMMILAND
jgi:hypothetical protein